MITRLVASWRRKRAASPGRLVAHIAAETALVTIVMYATGWGPVLSIGYMFLVHDVVGNIGARAWRVALVCALAGIALGQLAVAAEVAPSFIPHPRVHGLAALGRPRVGVRRADVRTGQRGEGSGRVRPSCAASGA